MTARTRSTLYGYYTTGSYPSQSNFDDLIDSSLNLTDPTAQAITSNVSALGTLDVNGAFTVVGSALASLTGNATIGGALKITPLSTVGLLSNSVAGLVSSVTALPSGTTAATQASNDSSTKVATTAFTNPANSQAAAGYVTLPCGLIIQWGISGTVTSGSLLAVTLPLTFPNHFYSINATSNASAVTAVQYFSANIVNTSSFQLGLNTGTQTANWIAIGN